MTELYPFEYLVELTKSYRDSAPMLPEQYAAVDSWSGIGFNLLGKRMISPMGDIVEMLPVPEAVRLPGVQPWVLGLANVRGRLLPLFDLEQFFGGKLNANKPKHRVLIIELGDLYAGLVVNDVYGMQLIPEDVKSQEVSEELSLVSIYSSGAYEKDKLTWTVFSPAKLVRDSRFFNASAT